MTFLELRDDDSRDLALDLFYAGDAPDLDQAAALAADMQAVLADVAYDWDFDVTTQAIEANDWETIAAAHTLPLP
jgi:hypothetical protein